MPIDIDALSYSVSDRSILCNIGLFVPDGAAVRIRGRTGAGKSTLGQLLARRIPAPALPGYNGIGRRWRWVDGDCSAMRLALPPTANYLSADPYETLIFPSVRDAFPSHFSPKQVRESLGLVGLDAEVAMQDTWQLSGGMLQRLCLARAQAYDRPLLVADQLYEWLDEDGRKLLSALISAHAGRGGIVVALESTASIAANDFPVYKLEPNSLRPMETDNLNAWGDKSGSSAGTTTVLEVSNLFKRFRRGRETQPVIKALSLTVKSGEWVGIRGANGSGKSVLAKLISGLDQEDSGRVRIGGHDTTDVDRRRAVAFVFQLPSHQLPFPTVNDHVQRLLPQARRAEVYVSLANLHIKRTQRVADLTPHLQRMLVLSLIACRDPLVVIADEPTWGADREEVKEFIAMLRTFGRNVAILLISHDHKFLHTFSDRLLELQSGRITSEVLANEPF